jgi:glycerol uptake facilitator-like aquaporin
LLATKGGKYFPFIAEAEEKFMRGIILAVLTVGSISVAGSSPAKAYTYPYCIQSSLDGSDCNYYTYNQCLAAASGRGVECIMNPIVAFAQQYPPGAQQYSPGPPPRQRRARRNYDY